jgi:hypothetical protein
VHKDAIVLCLLFTADFVLKISLIMQYAWVGGADLFVHYGYSMALLEGRQSVPVGVNGTNTMLEPYYLPLFHALSLGLFLTFPTLDPYATMEILAVNFHK